MGVLAQCVETDVGFALSKLRVGVVALLPFVDLVWVVVCALVDPCVGLRGFELVVGQFGMSWGDALVVGEAVDVFFL